MLKTKEISVLVLFITSVVGSMLTITKVLGQNRIQVNEKFTVDGVIKQGCWEEQDIKRLTNSLINYTRQVYGKDQHAGTYTVEAAEKVSARSQWMTKASVIDPNTWGYRVLLGWEAKELEKGNLVSKAHNRLISGQNENDFWNLNGPNLQWVIYGANTDIGNALRILALADSSKPVSQFVSVALDVKVAERFEAGQTYVYSFQVDPNSPIFGLKNCHIDENPENSEAQFQIAGGTSINHLRRKIIKASNNDWEKWDGKEWKKIRSHDEL